MNNYQRYFDISNLIAKHLRNELSDPEKKELNAWLESDAGNQELFRKLTDEGAIGGQLESYSASNKDAAWENIVKRTGFKNKTTPSRGPRQLIKYAAVLLILASAGLIISKYATKRAVAIRQAQHEPDLLPGTNKAILTLANGSKIVLDDKMHGKIAREQFISINKTQTGKIVYSVDSTPSAAELKAMNELAAMNTISTPRGGQYEVVLPDGTRVWLNAASSLTYPVIFKGRQRRVELSGEAYFEVAKNAAIPFLVKTSRQTIEVLGTHFNINNYADENAAKITLLEGSVKVGVTGEKTSVMLKPGQQSVYEANTLHVVGDADIDEAIAWKNGKFLFRDADLHSVMRQISRWYDVDVEYQGAVSGGHYRGRISRNVPVSQVFEILKTSGINFIINGRKIIVKP